MKLAFQLQLLRAFGADIIFGVQQMHIVSASKRVMSGLVQRGVIFEPGKNRA